MTYPGMDSDLAWRRLVFPAGYRNPAPESRYNLVVIGAGPAGLVTSIAAAGLGARVALVERHAMGGDCLNVGCVPSKTLLAGAAAGLGFAAAFARMREIRSIIARHDSVERYSGAGVDVYLGEAQFEDPHHVRVGDAVLHARKTVIATGARALLPPVPGLRELPALTNESIFDLQSQPRRLAILGAGPIGCELAQAFARLGTAVDLIEMQSRVLPADDEEAAMRVAAQLEKDGVRLRLGARVLNARRTPGGATLELEGGPQVVADEVIAATGRLRNVESLGLERAGVRFDPRTGIAVDARLRTSHPDIYAAGDVCSQHQFTHSADAQARIVVRNSLFHGRARADRLIPAWCTYTRPEVAHVGARRADLDRAGTRYDLFRCDFGDLDRGKTDDGGDGFAEVLTAAGSDRLLGATIVGKDAGEQLAPLVVMMSTGIGLGSLSSTVLPYPTRSEYLRRIADAWNRKRLTPRTRDLLGRWLRWTR